MIHSIHDGDEENPARYTKSSQKVTTNFKSGSFEPHAVAELIFQSNRCLEPMIKWDAHGRRMYDYQQAKLLATDRMRQKYKSQNEGFNAYLLFHRLADPFQQPCQDVRQTHPRCRVCLFFCRTTIHHGRQHVAVDRWHLVDEQHQK